MDQHIKDELLLPVTLEEKVLKALCKCVVSVLAVSGQKAINCGTVEQTCERLTGSSLVPMGTVLVTL